MIIAFPALRFAPLSLLVWALLALAVVSLASCGHYEPPGQDIWRAL